jgi:hypothetical protein
MNNGRVNFNERIKRFTFFLIRGLNLCDTKTKSLPLTKTAGLHCNKNVII